MLNSKLESISPLNVKILNKLVCNFYIKKDSYEKIAKFGALDLLTMINKLTRVTKILQ